MSSLQQVQSKISSQNLSSIVSMLVFDFWHVLKNTFLIVVLLMDANKTSHENKIYSTLLDIMQGKKFKAKPISTIYNQGWINL